MLRIITTMLGVWILTPSIAVSRENTDSLVLNRMFSYRRNYGHHIGGMSQNVYLKYTYTTERRNATLFLVPTMYSIAKGSRSYLGEAYCRLNFREQNDYDIQRQVVTGTIPHHRNAMPAMLQMITPAIYDETIYAGHILSPFHRANIRFYRYRVVLVVGGLVRVYFTPKVLNTQLIRGSAYIDYRTGKVLSAEYDGEYDMIGFHVEVSTGSEDNHSLLPQQCDTEATFKFMGNHITATCSATYNCSITLPDSIRNRSDLLLMDSLRPRRLEDYEEQVDEERRRQTTDTLREEQPQEKRRRSLTDAAWDVISDHLVSSLKATSEDAYFKMSPILNPMYLSYSHSRGLSYKIKIHSQYNFSPHRYLSLNPRLGYNFKINQFFFTAPLRMTYNPKRNGYAELTWANGNRITNSSVLREIKNERRDTIDFSRMNLDYFDDEYLQAVNNVVAFDWLEIMAGVVYHRRAAVNKAKMAEVGKPTEYRSFAPMLTLRLRPWLHRGPLLTLNYERSIKDVLRSNTEYERWEADAVYKYKLRSMRQLNLRIGGGLYTNKNSSYFVDFTNFRDNNLPEGWDDDWTGQFQLLNSSWYNASKYYIRTNISYDSPLLLLSHLPLVGRFVESERIYVSALNIEHTHPYFEIGYGLTNRYFSIGAFASLLNEKVQEVGCKFTFELFSRW